MTKAKKKKKITKPKKKVTRRELVCDKFPQTLKEKQLKCDGYKLATTTVIDKYNLTDKEVLVLTFLVINLEHKHKISHEKLVPLMFLLNNITLPTEERKILFENALESKELDEILESLAKKGLISTNKKITTNQIIEIILKRIKANLTQSFINIDLFDMYKRTKIWLPLGITYRKIEKIKDDRKKLIEEMVELMRIDFMFSPLERPYKKHKKISVINIKKNINSLFKELKKPKNRNNTDVKHHE